MMSKHITNKAERQFAELLESRNNCYIYQPKDSRLIEIKYTPDFYIWTEDTFYEVVGSRQAFNQNRNKILAAKEIVHLRIISPNGEDYNYRDVNRKVSSTRIPVMNSSSYIFANFDVPLFLNDYKLEPKVLAEILGVNRISIYNYIRSGRVRKTHLDILKGKKYSVENYYINY